MLVAVTGGTGFLGRYVLRHLTSQGHRIRCWHRPHSDRSDLEAISDRVEWRPGQLTDSAAEAALVDGVDAVVHDGLLWPRQHPRRRLQSIDFNEFVRVNLLGTLQLMRTAHQAGVGRFISTCAVHEVILDDRPLDETHPLWPTTPYGAYKAAAEAYVSHFGRGEGWKICSLRPTGIYGPAHPIEHSKWYDLVQAVLRDEPIKTPRGGKEVHAADVAKAVGLLLTAPGVAGQAYNCYDLYVAEEHVAQIAKELTGSQSEIARLNKGPQHEIDTQKIRALGMTFGGEELLRETVAQLTEHARRHGAG
jgi:nucleoside-diphosphate-sugar epimerase